MSRKNKRNYPQQQRPAATAPINHQVLAVNHHQFSGPLPPPALLNEYNLIVPGLAERIVTMAEKEQAQRHEQERNINNTNIQIASNDASMRATGQWMAFFIAILGMGISGLLIYKDHSIAGTIMGGGFLVALVAVFMTGQHQKEQ